MKNEVAIVDAINFLDSFYNKHGKIEKYIERLRKCDIRFKTYNPIWIPYKASTTYGSYNIRVAIDWMDWGPTFVHAVNLLHEVKHCFWYDKHSWVWIKYLANKKYRKAMEKDAESFVSDVMGFRRKV